MKSARQNITIERVNQLKPGETLWASSPTGFCCRRQGSAKVYGLKYRFQGKQRWLTIGKHGSPWTPETASRQAKQLLGLLADGIDPAEKRDADKLAPTVSALCDRFLNEHAKAKRKTRTVSEYARLIDKIIKPALGEKLAKNVTRADIAKLHGQLRNTPYQANRVLAVLSKLFNLAEIWGERADSSNPCRHVEKFSELKRERMLSSIELEALGSTLRTEETKAARAVELDRLITLATSEGRIERAKTLRSERNMLGPVMSPQAIAAIRLLIFTGARLSEITGLKWEWIDFERGEVRLPDSKTGAKTIHLSAPALAVLSQLPRIDGNPYAITGQRKGRRMVNLEKPWRHIRNTATVLLWKESAGSPASEIIAELCAGTDRMPSYEECVAAAAAAKIELPLELSNLRLHDLRHAFASVAASSGMGLPIIGKILGHTQSQTTHRYAHLAADPVKAAVTSIAAKIAAQMSGAAVSHPVDSPPPENVTAKASSK